MPVTEQQARAITFLAIAARPTGAPRWDEAGIFANVMKVADRSLAAVVIATIQAAEDRKALSPGVIPKPGPHWRDPASAPVPEVVAFDRASRCTTCYEPEATCRARADHPFESIERHAARDYSSTAERVARAKALIEPTRTWPARESHPTRPRPEYVEAGPAVVEESADV